MTLLNIKISKYDSVYGSKAMSDFPQKKIKAYTKEWQELTLMHKKEMKKLLNEEYEQEQ